MSEMPPAPPPPVQATMDASGTVRMDFTMSPEDRRVLRQVAQEQAHDHAERIGNPAGLRGLFPSNKVRTVIKRRPSLVAKEAQP